MESLIQNSKAGLQPAASIYENDNSIKLPSTSPQLSNLAEKNPNFANYPYLCQICKENGGISNTLNLVYKQGAINGYSVGHDFGYTDGFNDGFQNGSSKGIIIGAVAGSVGTLLAGLFGILYVRHIKKKKEKEEQLYNSCTQTQYQNS